MYALILPILISIVSITAGLFFFLRPGLAIEIQKKFYAKINWRIEPISMSREIRNTRGMGLFLVIMAILIIMYMLV